MKTEKFRVIQNEKLILNQTKSFKMKKASLQGSFSEVTSGIEPLYTVLQTVA